MKPITVSLTAAATLLLLAITVQRVDGVPAADDHGASRKRREAILSDPAAQDVFNAVRGIVEDTFGGGAGTAPTMITMETTTAGSTETTIAGTTENITSTAAETTTEVTVPAPIET